MCNVSSWTAVEYSQMKWIEAWTQKQHSLCHDLKGYFTPNENFVVFSLTPMSFRTRKEETLLCLILNKVVIFVLFPYKKYSLVASYIMIEPPMADGVFWRCFSYFMDLDSAIYLAVNGTATSLPVFIQNILNCVLKTNEAFTGSERHGGKWKNDKIFILGWSIPLTSG